MAVGGGVLVSPLFSSIISSSRRLPLLRRPPVCLPGLSMGTGASDGGASSPPPTPQRRRQREDSDGSMAADVHRDERRGCISSPWFLRSCMSVRACCCCCCFSRQADPWRQTRTHTPVQPLGSCSLCRPRQENLAARSSSASARHVQPDPTGRTPCCVRGPSEMGPPWAPVTQATTGNEFASGELWP